MYLALELLSDTRFIVLLLILTLAQKYDVVCLSSVFLCASSRLCPVRKFTILFGTSTAPAAKSARLTLVWSIISTRCTFTSPMTKTHYQIKSNIPNTFTFASIIHSSTFTGVHYIDKGTNQRRVNLKNKLAASSQAFWQVYDWGNLNAGVHWLNIICSSVSL